MNSLKNIDNMLGSVLTNANTVDMCVCENRAETRICAAYMLK